MNHITTDEYNQRLKNFYLCKPRDRDDTNIDSTSNNMSAVLVENVTLIRTMIGIITVPVVNSILFYKYVQKYRQLSQSIANASLQIKSTVSNSNINSDSDDKHDQRSRVVPLSM